MCTKRFVIKLPKHINTRPAQRSCASRHIALFLFSFRLPFLFIFDASCIEHINLIELWTTQPFAYLLPSCRRIRLHDSMHRCRVRRDFLPVRHTQNAIYKMLRSCCIVSLSPCQSSHHISVGRRRMHERKWEKSYYICFFFFFFAKASNRNWIERINNMHGINLAPSPRRYFEIANMKNRLCCVAVINAKYSNSAVRCAAFRRFVTPTKYACWSYVIFCHADEFSLCCCLSANFYSRSLHRRQRQWPFHTYAVAASTELSLECVYKLISLSCSSSNLFYFSLVSLE